MNKLYICIDNIYDKKSMGNKPVNLKGSKEYLRPEVENRILTLIKELEQKNFFIIHNYSIQKLAKEIGFNKKYVSYVINKHFGINFPCYINNLRINFIMELIEGLNYLSSINLTSLAKISGFSSYSKFSNHINKTFGMCPTLYFKINK